MSEYWWQHRGMGTTSGGGQMWTYGSRAKVRKIKNSLYPDHPWQVSNHPLGPATFRTWDEAMIYARSRPRLMNNAPTPRCPNEGSPCFCTGACQPKHFPGLDHFYSSPLSSDVGHSSL